MDVAIRLGPVRSPDLVARRICSTRWFTCASPDYLEKAGRPRTPEDLRRHRLIGFLGAGGRPRKWTFEHRGQRQSPTLPFSIAFNMADAQLSAALRGNGIVQTVDMLVSEQLRSQRLVRVLPEYATAGPAISAVFLASQRNSVKIRVFADFAAEMLQRLRQELDADTPA